MSTNRTMIELTIEKKIVLYNAIANNDHQLVHQMFSTNEKYNLDYVHSDLPRSEPVQRPDLSKSIYSTTEISHLLSTYYFDFSNMSPLVMAGYLDLPEIVYLLLSAGADINYKLPLNPGLVSLDLPSRTSYFRWEKPFHLKRASFKWMCGEKVLLQLATRSITTVYGQMPITNCQIPYYSLITKRDYLRHTNLPLTTQHHKLPYSVFPLTKYFDAVPVLKNGMGEKGKAKMSNCSYFHMICSMWSNGVRGDVLVLRPNSILDTVGTHKIQEADAQYYFKTWSKEYDKGFAECSHYHYEKSVYIFLAMVESKIETFPEDYCKYVLSNTRFFYYPEQIVYLITHSELESVRTNPARTIYDAFVNRILTNHCDVNISNQASMMNWHEIIKRCQKAFDDLGGGVDLSSSVEAWEAQVLREKPVAGLSLRDVAIMSRHTFPSAVNQIKVEPTDYVLLHPKTREQVKTLGLLRTEQSCAISTIPEEVMFNLVHHLHYVSSYDD